MVRPDDDDGLRFVLSEEQLAAMLAGGGAGVLSLMPEPTTASRETGGQTIARHVGKTEAQLRERLWLEPDRKIVSSFAGLDLAESTIEEVMHANTLRIEDWANSPVRAKPLELVQQVSGEVGYGIGRETGESTRMGGVKIILKYQTHNDMPYYIVTAYVHCGAGVPKTNYKEMDHFFGVYFCQDYDLFGNTFPELVTYYRRHSPRADHLELAAEIDAFVAEHPDDLDVAFDRDYGREIDPRSWDYTIASLLADMKRLLVAEEGGIMPSERYPEMGRIFGVYFGEDFDWFGDTIPEIVSIYRNDCPGYRDLVRELDAFIAEHPDDLDTAFKEGFSLGVDLTLLGYTTASFFGELRDLLRG